MRDQPTPKAFQDLFRRLVVAYQPRAIERDTLAVYWSILGAEFSLPVLEFAAVRLTRTQRFFPSVAEWRAAALRAASQERWQQLVADRDPCPDCANLGLVRIEYRSGEPFDIAICRCAHARFYQQAGPEFVRRAYALLPSQRVADLDAFSDESETGT